MPKKPQEILRRLIKEPKLPVQLTPPNIKLEPKEKDFISVLLSLEKANLNKTYTNEIKPGVEGKGAEIDATLFHKAISKIILSSNNRSVMLVLRQEISIDLDNDFVNRFGIVSKDMRSIIITIPKLKIYLTIKDNVIEFNATLNNIKIALVLLNFVRIKRDLSDPRTTKLTQNRPK